MARKPASSSRPSAAAQSSSFHYGDPVTSTAPYSTQLSPPNATSSDATHQAGGTAPAQQEARLLSSSASAMQRRPQPKSKNHGRFPCSIPGCFAVANHLSSMCRHKWGHLPQRLLPACRGHLPSGAPCPVKYQGRADTMKRHWLTHHTNEGPWVPDRYPPFEDLWRMVQEGEIVLTPPSKYAYDSPAPELPNTALSAADPSGGDLHSVNTARRNSVGQAAKPYSLSRLDGVASRRNDVAGRARSHTYSGRTGRAGPESGPREVRISKGNTRPWRLSDPALAEPADLEELDELEVDPIDEEQDVDMIEATTSEISNSPSRHSHQSFRHSPMRPHSARSPHSPASLRSFGAEQDGTEVEIHVPYATIPPITPLTPAVFEPAIIRYPLLPAAAANCQPMSSSNGLRELPSDYGRGYVRHQQTKSRSVGALGLLALSASGGYLQSTENMLPHALLSQQQVVKASDYYTPGGAYVYGHKNRTPPGPTFMPASIPHSELSLMSHPPTDRIMSASPGPVNNDLPPIIHDRTSADTWYPPMRLVVSPPGSEEGSQDHEARLSSAASSYDMWQAQPTLRPLSGGSH